MIGFVISTLSRERQDSYNDWFAPQWRIIDPAIHMLVQFMLSSPKGYIEVNLNTPDFDFYKNKHTS